MIELTFLEFHEQKYVNEGFRLYVMKNCSREILYVGISATDIWTRWFGWSGHLIWDRRIMYAQTPVGQKIIDHLPDSLDWKIQLWTLKDCVEYCRHDLPGDSTRLSIRDIEPYMIQKLAPALNITYNLSPGKDNTPRSEKELKREKYLDRMYREIFDDE